MLSSSNSRRILELLRLYHFNARYLSNDYPQGLRSIEEAVLVAMASLSEIRAAEVVAALHVDKSTVSKALTSLRRGRYVTSSVNLHDKRVRSIAFTKRGSQHLQKHAAYHQKLVAAFSAHLTTDELNRLQDYLTRFADGDGAAPIAAREAESPLIVQMRRLGRAHSILGSSYLGSEFSIGEWLVLCAVRDLTAPVTPTLLSRWIGVPKNTLSQMLSRLRSKRLISTRDLRHDGRKLEVVLRSAGISALQSVEMIARKRFSRALESFSEEQVEDFIAIFSRYIGEPPNPEIGGELLLRGNRTIRKLSAAAEVQHARGFHLMNIVAANQHWNAPAAIYADTSRTYGVFDGEKLEAVGEVVRGAKSVRVINVSTPLGEHTGVLDLLRGVARLDSLIGSTETFEVELSPFTDFLVNKCKVVYGSLQIDSRSAKFLREEGP